MKHVDRWMIVAGLLALLFVGVWTGNRADFGPLGVQGYCGPAGGGHCGCAAVATACNMPCQPGGCCPTMPCPVDGCAGDDR